MELDIVSHSCWALIKGAEGAPHLLGLVVLQIKQKHTQAQGNKTPGGQDSSSCQGQQIQFNSFAYFGL